MSKEKVYVALTIAEEDMARLREKFEVDAWDQEGKPPRETALEKIAGCVGVITSPATKVDAEFFDAAGPRLKVVSNTAVGVDNFDFMGAKNRNIRLGHTADKLTKATAALAFTLMQAAARQLEDGRATIDANEWMGWSLLANLDRDIDGKTLGVVGLGRIGREVARKAHRAYDMRILYFDREPRPEAAISLGAERATDLVDLCNRADFVTVHVDLNPTTHHLIKASHFEAMGTEGVFVNTSRGLVVDEDALYEALTARKIYSAGIDVFEDEPVRKGKKNERFMGLKNLIRTPHTASRTEESRLGMSRLAVDNLIAGVEGRPLPTDAFLAAPNDAV